MKQSEKKISFQDELFVTSLIDAMDIHPQFPTIITIQDAPIKTEAIMLKLPLGAPVEDAPDEE